MRKLFWLEDKPRDWTKVIDTADSNLIDFQIFQDPKTLREELQDHLEEHGNSSAFFVIDLILAGVKSYYDWPGNLRQVHSGRSTEAGLRAIEFILWHQDCPARMSPLAVLTQRVDEGHIRNEIDGIASRNAFNPDYQVFTKNRTPMSQFEKWVRSAAQK